MHLQAAYSVPTSLQLGRRSRTQCPSVHVAAQHFWRHSINHIGPIEHTLKFYLCPDLPLGTFPFTCTGCLMLHSQATYGRFEYDCKVLAEQLIIQLTITARPCLRNG